MNPEKILKIALANKLSDLMVGSLRSGEKGESVQGGPKQLDALIERELIDPDEHTLTERGHVLVRALNGEDLSSEDEVLVYPTSTPSSGSRYFILTTPDGPVIRPFSEAGPDDAPLSFPDAKEKLIEYASEMRDKFRQMIKDVRSLRRKDVDGTDAGAEGDNDMTDSDQAETLV